MPKLPPEPLTPDEARRLLDAPTADTWIGKRNRALMTLLYRSGVRCAEACALRVQDLDPVAGTVRVLHGKGDKSRTVGMDKRAFETVAVWLSVRGVGSGPLFTTKKGLKLATSYVRALFTRMGIRAGISKRVHPHGLRHTLACEMRREGLELGIIQAQLGHSSAATTAKYLDHLNPQALIDAMRDREWQP